jgi:hypothetical protein
MLIALVVLLTGIPLFLLLAPRRQSRNSVRLAAIASSANQEPAASAPAQLPEPGSGAFELPLRSEAQRHG